METLVHIYDYKNFPDSNSQNSIIEFLYKQLGKYGDEKSAIAKCMAYALDSNELKGGFVMTLESKEILGAVIINNTGMQDYIPENILVYIATHSDYRGKGLGSKLLKESIAHSKGDIALHVEPNNPAKKLYEKFGFTNPYLEMRLKK